MFIFSLSFLSYICFCLPGEEGIAFSELVFGDRFSIPFAMTKGNCPATDLEAEADPPGDRLQILSLPFCKYYSHHRMVVLTVINILLTIM